MAGAIAALWRRMPSDLTARTEACLARACDRLGQNAPARIFFRADDVAVPARQFARLVELFNRRQWPLCLAVVPAWLTDTRRRCLYAMGAKNAALFCWHQHGWRHVNHESTEKKQEFGPARSRDACRRDILRGRRRLAQILGPAFCPVFTPPWNRCSADTLHLLAELDFAAVSGSRGSLPTSADGLPDLAVNVDLHTRREADALSGWQGLFSELEQALGSGCCGIMIHHQNMNAAAFDFLERLLKLLETCGKVQPVHFKDLL